MSWPLPQPGLVIRYSYLWNREARLGREEGVKDRPCAIVLVILHNGTTPLVRVLPITHVPPQKPEDALEIPALVKQRLGLDDARSWIVLTEANDFVWPGPDLRPAVNGNPESAALGFLPPGFFKVLKEKLAALYNFKTQGVVRRTS